MRNCRWDIALQADDVRWLNLWCNETPSSGITTPSALTWSIIEASVKICIQESCRSENSDKVSCLCWMSGRDPFLVMPSISINNLGIINFHAGVVDIFHWVEVFGIWHWCLLSTRTKEKQFWSHKSLASLALGSFAVPIQPAMSNAHRYGRRRESWLHGLLEEMGVVLIRFG